MMLDAIIQRYCRTKVAQHRLSYSARHVELAGSIDRSFGQLLSRTWIPQLLTFEILKNRIVGSQQDLSFFDVCMCNAAFVVQQIESVKQAFENKSHHRGGQALNRVTMLQVEYTFPKALDVQDNNVTLSGLGLRKSPEVFG